jgi:hypothetical protein
MNERIRQLAEQAGEYVNTVYTPPVRSKTPDKIWEDGHIGWNEQFNEKFAELIVRECAQVASDRVMDVEGNDWGVKWAIKNHFGVEQ